MGKKETNTHLHGDRKKAAARREAFLLDTEDKKRETLAILTERAAMKALSEGAGPIIAGLSMLIAIVVAIGAFKDANASSLLSVGGIYAAGALLVLVLYFQLVKVSGDRNRAAFWLDVYTRELPVAAGPRWF
jgi:hypothetical protein